MMKKQISCRYLAYTGIVLAAAVSAVLFFANISDRSDIFTWLLNAVKDRGLQMTFVFIGLYFMYSRIFFFEKFSQGKFSGERIFAAFCAVSFVFGDACAAENGLSALWNPLRQTFKSVCLFACYFLFALVCARWLHFLLRRFSCATPGACRLGRKHPFFFFFIALIVCWSPQLILKFPGTMCYDNYNQLAQYFGYIDFSSAHPPLHTLLLGLCFDFGLLFSSANLGLFTAVLLQTLLLAAVFSYTLLLMVRMNSPSWLLFVSFGFYVLTPNIIGYLSLPLLRHNGLITVIPLSLYMAGRTLFQNRKVPLRAIRRACALCMTLAIIAGAEVAIELTIHPKSTSIGESLAFPFQQTARYVRDHPEDVTLKEAQIIDRILDYDRLGDLYNPRIFDPVKDTFKKDSSLSDLAAYFGVWVKQFFRHPITYIEATASQSYSLFYPKINNIKYYPSVNTHNPLEPSIVETSNLHGLAVFDRARSEMTRFYTILHNLPIVGTLSNPGFLTLFLLLLWTLSHHYKLKGMGLALAPALLTVGMCIFAPVIMYQLRYAFPMIYSIPLLTAVYVFAQRQKVTTTDKVLPAGE